MTDRAYMPQAQRTDWQTPPELFDKLTAEFGPFDLDPCGHPLSYVSQHCGTYYAKDGLDKPWFGRVFVNPPYGRELGKWVAKCYADAHRPDVVHVVALLPVRTDVRWWQNYVVTSLHYSGYVGSTRLPIWEVESGAHEVRFLKGRLKFVGAKASAPFPSAIVVWRKP